MTSGCPASPPARPIWTSVWNTPVLIPPYEAERQAGVVIAGRVWAVGRWFMVMVRILRPGLAHAGAAGKLVTLTTQCQSATPDC